MCLTLRYEKFTTTKPIKAFKCVRIQKSDKRGIYRSMFPPRGRMMLRIRELNFQPPTVQQLLRDYIANHPAERRNRGTDATYEVGYVYESKFDDSLGLFMFTKLKAAREMVNSFSTPCTMLGLDGTRHDLRIIRCTIPAKTECLQDISNDRSHIIAETMEVTGVVR